MKSKRLLATLLVICLLLGMLALPAMAEDEPLPEEQTGNAAAVVDTALTEPAEESDAPAEEPTVEVASMGVVSVPSRELTLR